MKNIVSIIFLSLSFAFAQSAHSKISDFVVRSEATVDFCQRAKLGEPCRATYYEALYYCQSIGGKIPSARDFAAFAVAHGARGILEVDDPLVVDGLAPEGFENIYTTEYYRPEFFYSHSGFKAPDTSWEAPMIVWTSSAQAIHSNDPWMYQFSGPRGLQALSGGGSKTDYQYIRCDLP